MGKIKQPANAYIVDKKGKRTAVVMPIEKYEELMEDLEDLAVIASRKAEPTYDWKNLKKKLKVVTIERIKHRKDVYRNI